MLKKHFAKRAIGKHLEAGYRDVELGPIGFKREHINYHHVEFTAVSRESGEKVRGGLRYNRWIGVHRMAVEPVDGRKAEPAPVVPPKKPNRLNL